MTLENDSRIAGNDIVTPLGIFRKFKYAEDDLEILAERAPYVWQCPSCKRWGGMNWRQFKGQVSVFCAFDNPQDCTYHETHDFEAAVNDAIAQAHPVDAD